MEQQENQTVNSNLSFEEQFKKLPVGNLIKIPVSHIHPTDPNDGRKSMTDGPIKVYQEKNTNKLFIYDGNHRFYDKEMELIMKLGYENRDNEPIEVEKVINDKPWG